MTATKFKPITGKPRVSYRFGSKSLYIHGVYYFPEDIKESSVRDESPYEVQGVYYDGKWRQDTFYISAWFRNYLMDNK